MWLFSSGKKKKRSAKVANFRSFVLFFYKSWLNHSEYSYTKSIKRPKLHKTNLKEPSSTSTARFSLPGLTLGELVHLPTTYFTSLELYTHWGKDSELGWVDRSQCLQHLLKASFKHLWTLPWTPGSHHHLNRSTEGREAHPGPECLREPLHFRWFDSQLYRRFQHRGGELRASDPSILLESGKAQTQGTPFFSLWGNLIWKHYWEKESTETR